MTSTVGGVLGMPTWRICPPMRAVRRVADGRLGAGGLEHHGHAVAVRGVQDGLDGVRFPDVDRLEPQVSGDLQALGSVRDEHPPRASQPGHLGGEDAHRPRAGTAVTSPTFRFETRTACTATANGSMTAACSG